MSFFKRNDSRKPYPGMSMFFALAFFLIASRQHGFAQCDFSVGVGTSPCIFTFTSDVKGVDGYLIVHEWDFGDGCTSDVANPVHSYPSIPAGGPSQMYTVKHTVTAIDPFTMLPIVGSPFICNQTVTVTPSTSCQLCPSLGEQGGGFNYHVNGCVVKFQSNLSGLFTHIWNFGDNSPLVIGITDPVHDYDVVDPDDTEGIYTVGLSASNGFTNYRCNRTIKVDCKRPNSDFTWSTGDGACSDCFSLTVTPVEQSPNATYGWWINGELVATGLQPNLFPHGINVCAVQQNGGTIEVSLVVQLDGESSPVTTKVIDLSNIEPAIYIGFGGGTTNMTDLEDVLPGSQYCGACKVKVCGIIAVDKNFEFCGANVEVVGGNRGFDVNQDITFKATGGTRIHGCECIWRGITMNPQSNIEVSGSSIIEDAANAIAVLDNQLLNPVSLTLNTAIIRNNYIGVRIGGRANFLAFTQNRFLTQGSLQLDCRNIIGSPYHTEIGYIGLFVDHQNSTLNLPDDDNGNRFINLAIGIYSRNGNFGLNNTATFENIKTCDYYQNNNGGTAVFFQNDASFTATNNDFRNIRTGIWGVTTVHTDVTITSNTMNAGTPSMARGIELHANTGGDMDGEVSNNNIVVNNVIPCLSTTDSYGIGFFDNTYAANNLLIKQNPITLNSNIAETHGILVAMTGNAGTPAAIEVDVDDNTITGQHASTAIEMRGIRRAAVHGNTINLSGNNNIIGLSVDGAESSFICSNTINNSGTNRGLQVLSARYNHIKSNLLNATSTGAFFSGDCGGSVIACNEFRGPQGIGLHYGTNTVITDPQENTGNSWTGTWNFGNQKALISVGANFPANQYIVPEGPSIYNPDNNQADVNGVLWFDDEQFVGDPDCQNPNLSGCMGFNRPAEQPEGTNDRNAAVAQAEIELSVAPNPNQGEFIVSFSNVPEEGASIQVFSLSGAWTRTYPVAGGQSSYAITGLQPGIYFVTLKTKDQSSTPVKIAVF